MKHKIILRMFCILCLMACPALTKAAFNSSPSLPELVQASEYICVGSVRNVQVLDRTEIDTGFNHKGKEDFIVAQNAVADFAVDSVLKGRLDSHDIKIAFFKNVPDGFNSNYFVQLIPGERIIVFLNSVSSKAGYSLLEPASHDKSKIPIGTVTLTVSPQGTAPLRAALLLLVQVLADDNKQVRFNCLRRIQSISYLLYNNTSVEAGRDAAKIREALAESPGFGLEDFVTKNVLPPVLKLTTDPDAAVSALALTTAAQLQDVEVLPQIVRLISSGASGYSDEASFAIYSYRNPAAVRPLISLLKSDIPDVRAQAAYSLGLMKNRLALPFLLDHVDDPDPAARRMIVNALYEITGEIPPPTPANDDGNFRGDIAFWRKWASQHTDELKPLRVKFNVDPR